MGASSPSYVPFSVQPHKLRRAPPQPLIIDQVQLIPLPLLLRVPSSAMEAAGVDGRPLDLQPEVEPDLEPQPAMSTPLLELPPLEHKEHPLQLQPSAAIRSPPPCKPTEQCAFQSQYLETTHSTHGRVRARPEG